ELTDLSRSPGGCRRRCWRRRCCSRSRCRRCCCGCRRKCRCGCRRKCRCRCRRKGSCRRKCSSRCSRRCRRRDVAVNERGALQYVIARGVVEHSSSVVTGKVLYESDSLVLLEGNDKAATQPREVARRISEHRG